MMTDGAVSNRNMSQSGDALIQMERAVMEADANFQVSRGGEKEGTKLEQRREDRTLAQHLHNAVVEKLDSQPWWRTAFEEVKDLFTAIT